MALSNDWLYPQDVWDEIVMERCMSEAVDKVDGRVVWSMVVVEWFGDDTDSLRSFVFCFLFFR